MVGSCGPITAAVVDPRISTENFTQTHLGARRRGERSHVVREARAGGKHVVHGRREGFGRGGLAAAQDVPQVLDLFHEGRERSGAGP